MKRPRIALLAGAVALASAFIPAVHAAGAFIPAAAQPYRLALKRAAHAQWGLDAPVADLAAQIHQESGWNPQAVSRVGAEGMAQFMPATARWWCEVSGTMPSECQPRNPAWALRALVGYDRWLWSRVSGTDNACERMAFALRAYNGGETRLSRERAACAGATGCDPARNFGHVERFNAGRSVANWHENTDYPRRILLALAPRYRGWGQGRCA